MLNRSKYTRLHEEFTKELSGNPLSQLSKSLTYNKEIIYCPIVGNQERILEEVAWGKSCSELPFPTEWKYFSCISSHRKSTTWSLLFSPLLGHPGYWCLTPAHKTSKARRPESPYLCEAKEVAAALGLDCTPGVCDGRRDKGVFYGPCRHWWERELAWIHCKFARGGCSGNPIRRICVEWAWGGVASGKLMQSLSHGDASSCCQWGLWRAMRAPTRGKTALDTLQIQSPWSHFTTVPVKRRLSCSSHLSSLPIVPHPERSEGVELSRQGWLRKKKDADCTPLPNSLAGANWSWGRREKGYVYWQRQYHMLPLSLHFFFLPRPTSQPPEIRWDCMISWGEGHMNRSDVCHIQMEAQRGPCVIL